MFGLLGERVSISMLAQTAGAIPSSHGPQGVADQTLVHASKLDLLIIPGGIGTRKAVEDTAFMELLKIRATEARLVATVCTGSALLAKTGLLDNVRATSNKLAFDWVTSQGPQVNWIRQARWVEEGKFFTSSGISAGIDMALGLIAHVFDRETALQVAHRAEYVWNENRDIDPFA